MYVVFYLSSSKSFCFIEHNIICFYIQDHMQKKKWLELTLNGLFHYAT